MQHTPAFSPLSHSNTHENRSTTEERHEQPLIHALLSLADSVLALDTRLSEFMVAANSRISAVEGHVGSLMRAAKSCKEEDVKAGPQQCTQKVRSPFADAGAPILPALLRGMPDSTTSPTPLSREKALALANLAVDASFGFSTTAVPCDTLNQVASSSVTNTRKPQCYPTPSPAPPLPTPLQHAATFHPATGGASPRHGFDARDDGDDPHAAVYNAVTALEKELNRRRAERKQRGLNARSETRLRAKSASYCEDFSSVAEQPQMLTEKKRRQRTVDRCEPVTQPCRASLSKSTRCEPRVGRRSLSSSAVLAAGKLNEKYANVREWIEEAASAGNTSAASTSETPKVAVVRKATSVPQSQPTDDSGEKSSSACGSSWTSTTRNAPENNTSCESSASTAVPPIPRARATKTSGKQDQPSLSLASKRIVYSSASSTVESSYRASAASVSASCRGEQEEEPLKPSHDCLASERRRSYAQSNRVNTSIFSKQGCSPPLSSSRNLGDVSGHSCSPYGLSSTAATPTVSASSPATTMVQLSPQTPPSAGAAASSSSPLACRDTGNDHVRSPGYHHHSAQLRIHYIQ